MVSLIHTCCLSFQGGSQDQSGTEDGDPTPQLNLDYSGAKEYSLAATNSQTDRQTLADGGNKCRHQHMEENTNISNY